MKIAEILKLTGASKPSIYRWMEKHPTVEVRDKTSHLGHPFPKPREKDGREVIWDDGEVDAWWSVNAGTIGRHPTDGNTITMKWDRFRAAMLVIPQVYEEEGVEFIDDDMALVHRFEKDGENVRLWFRDVSDAVLFKLKYA